MNILVTGSGSLLGQGIIKSLELSKLKFTLFATDYFSSAVGLYWAKKSFLLPDLLNTSITDNEWLDSLITILKNEKIQVLIPGLDFEIPVLSKYKSKIEEETSCMVIVSPQNVVKIGNDKWETVVFLKEHGFSFPKSCLPKDIKSFIADNNYPLIVKPRFGNTSKDVFIINDQNELMEALEKVDRPIIQEYLAGNKGEFTCSTVFVDEKIICTISLRRTLKNGNTSIAFLEDYPDIDNFINKVTKALRPFGPTNFQLRLTDEGPVIFEINPRFSGTTPIRALFGVNEVETTIEATLCNNFDHKFIKKPGVVIRYMDNEFIEWEDYNSFS